MQFFALFFLLFLNLNLYAQYDDLLRDPKITWVAEYTADFELNPVYNDKLEEENNFMRLIRLENKSETNGFYGELEISRYFSQMLLNGLNDGVYVCYADKSLQKPLSAVAVHALLNPADTTRGFEHPWDTIITINAVQPEDVALFRVRQVFYYQQKNRQFGCRLIAVAPLIDQHDKNGDFSGRNVLFWAKFPQSGKPSKKQDRAASYILQTLMKDNAPGPDQLSVKKGNLNLQNWATAEVDHPSRRSYTYDEFKPLTSAELHGLVYSADTLVTINDDGQAEIDRIVQKNAIEQVEKIRFVQNWYFDERRHTLECRLVAAAPLAAVRDSEGNFRYYKPLFYVRY